VPVSAPRSRSSSTSGVGVDLAGGQPEAEPRRRMAGEREDELELPGGRACCPAGARGARANRPASSARASASGTGGAHDLHGGPGGGQARALGRAAHDPTLDPRRQKRQLRRGRLGIRGHGGRLAGSHGDPQRLRVRVPRGREAQIVATLDDLEQKGALAVGHRREGLTHGLDQDAAVVTGRGRTLLQGAAVDVAYWRPGAGSGPGARRSPRRPRARPRTRSAARTPRGRRARRSCPAGTPSKAKRPSRAGVSRRGSAASPTSSRDTVTARRSSDGNGAEPSSASRRTAPSTRAGWPCNSTSGTSCTPPISTGRTSRRASS
jgi:hypothetical protein